MLEETRPGSGIIGLMETSGAMLSGHFELASGLHSEKYIQCALLLEDPVRAELVGKELARELGKKLGSSGAGVVVSPAVGGLIIGHEVARALGTRGIFAERIGGRMTLRRGFTEVLSNEWVALISNSEERHGSEQGNTFWRSTAHRQTLAGRLARRAFA